jgi:hypothetical protein
MLEHLKQTVKQVDEEIANPQNGDFMPLLINALYNANKGVVNLADTYKNEEEVSKQIAVQLGNMAVHLYRYQYLITEISNSEIRPVEVRGEPKSEVKEEPKQESPRKNEQIRRPQKPRKVDKKSL